MTRQESCLERVNEQWQGRKADLEALWKAYCNGKEDVEDLGSIFEYGLSFDYAAPGTFNDQNEAYWRYQLSWGGPSDEIRFYASDPDGPLYKAEYWFLDWGDGAKVHVIDEDIIKSLWGWFQDCCSTGQTMEDAGAR